MFKKIKNLTKQQIKQWIAQEIKFIGIYFIICFTAIYAFVYSALYIEIEKNGNIDGKYENFSEIGFINLINGKIFIALVIVYLVLRLVVFLLKTSYNELSSINKTEEIKLYKKLERGILKSNFTEYCFWCIGVIYLILSLGLILKNYFIIISAIIPMSLILYLTKKDKTDEKSYDENFIYVLEKYFDDNYQLYDNKKQIEFLKQLKIDIQFRYFNYTEIAVDALKIWIVITGFLFTISILKIDFKITIIPENISDIVYLGMSILVASLFCAMFNYLYKILINRKALILCDLDKYIEKLEEKERIQNKKKQKFKIERTIKINDKKTIKCNTIAYYKNTEDKDKTQSQKSE